MNKDVILEMERGQRVLGVVDKYPTDFAAQTPAAAVVIIRREVAALQTLPVDQTTGKATSTGATARKKTLLKELLKTMRGLRRTLLQLKKRDHSVTANLNPPVDEKDATIIATAQSYFDTLEPLKPLFIARGKKADFLDELQADIAEYNALVAAQESGTAQSEDSTDAIAQSEHHLIEALEDLDDYVLNMWENEPLKLGEWKRAEKRGVAHRNPGTVNPPQKTA